MPTTYIYIMYFPYLECTYLISDMSAGRPESELDIGFPKKLLLLPFPPPFMIPSCDVNVAWQAVGLHPVMRVQRMDQGNIGISCTERTKSLFAGCVKFCEKAVFCLPSACRNTQIFHTLFRKPGKILLVQPCTEIGLSRCTRFGEFCSC